MLLAELVEEYEAKPIADASEELYPGLHDALALGKHYSEGVKKRLLEVGDDIHAIDRAQQIGGWKTQNAMEKDERISQFLHSALGACANAAVVGRLPRTRRGFGAPAKLLGKCSLTTTTCLKRLANSLGLAIFRPSWAKRTSFELASYEVRGQITEFRSLSKYVDVYMMAPVDHYSVTEHTKSDQDGSVIAPSGWEQAFAAVDMMIPHLRMMEKKTETAMREMQDRLDKLALKVERAAVVAAQVARAKTEERPAIGDPLLFAVQRGADLDDFDYARVGPCWCPDIDADLVRELLGD
jgi:hypothetical protein